MNNQVSHNPSGIVEKFLDSADTLLQAQYVPIRYFAPQIQWLSQPSTQKRSSVSPDTH